MSRGIHLYCFARPGVLDQGDLFGIEGNDPVLALEKENVAALYSQVSLDEVPAATPSPCPLPEGRGLGEGGASPETAWLIRRVCRHAQVIEEIMKRSEVLPVRFGAVFSGPDALENLLSSRQREIAGFLDCMLAKEEWEVKGTLDSPRAEAWLLATDPVFAHRVSIMSGSLGTRYFQERRLKGDLQQQVQIHLRATMEECLQDWRATVAEFRLIQARAARNDGEVLFHGAFLVKHEQAPEFCRKVMAAAEREAARGLVLVNTGPLPPFHFCPSLEGPVP